MLINPSSKGMEGSILIAQVCEVSAHGFIRTVKIARRLYPVINQSRELKPVQFGSFVLIVMQAEGCIVFASLGGHNEQVLSQSTSTHRLLLTAQQIDLHAVEQISLKAQAIYLN